MPMNESDADFMFKKIYPKGLDADCLLRNHPMLKWAKHDTKFTSQKGLEIPVPYTNPQGIGSDNATAYAAEAPSGGNSFTIPQRHIIAYGTIDAKVVRNAAAGDRESQFADIVEREVDGTTESLGSELNQRGYGANDGVRSFLSATDVVNTNFAFLKNLEDTQLYEVNMRLQFVNPANGTLRSGTGLLVTSVADGKLGLNATPTSVGAVAGDGILRLSMNNKDLDGTKGWCPDVVASTGDNFLGVNRYIYRNRLAGIFVDRSNLSVRSGLLSAFGVAKAQVGAKFDKKSPLFINPKNLTQIKQTLEAVRVIEGSMEDSYGIGIDTVDCLGFKFIEDAHCPVDEVQVIGSKAWVRGSCGDQPYIEKHDNSRFAYNRKTGFIEFTLAHDGNMYSPEPYNIMRVKINSQAA